MKALDYAHQLRDTQLERQLASTVRQLPEDEALAFIVEMLDVNLAVGLDLANKCLRRRAHWRELLGNGLRRANASSIRFWIESLGPRLGLSEVIRVLREWMENDTEAVGRAAYFLPSLVATGEAAAADTKLVRDFQAEVDAKLKAPRV